MNKIKNFLAFLMLLVFEAAFFTMATDGSFSGMSEEKLMIALTIILGIYILYCIHAVFTKQKMELPPIMVFMFFGWPLFFCLNMFRKKDSKQSRKREIERKMEVKFLEEYERWLWKAVQILLIIK